MTRRFGRSWRSFPPWSWRRGELSWAPRLASRPPSGGIRRPALVCGRAPPRSQGGDQQPRGRRSARLARGRRKCPTRSKSEELLRERLAEAKEELAQMKPPSTEVRREAEIATQLLDARSAQALMAARIKPPAYIVKELGQGP